MVDGQFTSFMIHTNTVSPLPSTSFPTDLIVPSYCSGFKTRWQLLIISQARLWTKTGVKIRCTVSLNLEVILQAIRL